MDETTITPGPRRAAGPGAGRRWRHDGHGVDGSTVKLRLVVETASCVECVMPREILEQVALNIFRATASTPTWS